MRNREKRMSYPRCPRLLKGGIVLIDPESGAVQRVISLQYSPKKVTRTFQAKGVGADSRERSRALGLKEARMNIVCLSP